MGETDDPGDPEIGETVAQQCARTLGRVARIDPKTMQVKQRLQLKNVSDADGISAGPGGIWVTNGISGKVSRVNPTPPK